MNTPPKPFAIPFAFALLTLAPCAGGGAPSPAGDAGLASSPTRLEEQFAAPPDASHPWVYYWWLKANVDRETITRDLEGMKRQGIGGFLLFDARGYHEEYVPPPESKMDFMGADWRRMVAFTMREANRLGLRLSVNLSSCAGALRGPWDVGEDTPKRLVWSATPIDGPKAFAGSLPAPDAPGHRPVATLAVRHGSAAAKGAAPVADAVIDLRAKIGADGALTWDAPAGHWTILRLAYAPMEDRANDVDILNAKAVRGHFERMGRALLADAGSLAGKTLTHFYSVSWEGAIPTWTPGFEAEFARRRGYDPIPWLPALAGFTVRAPDVTARFLRDYNRTLADCFMDNCYGTLRGLCNAAGLQWHSESGGPWNRKLPTFEHADQFAFLARNDMPQDEFWHLGRAMNRPAAIAAHTYGKPFAAVEAFTHMRKHWSAYPAALKPDADAAFCDGSNFFIWHTFPCSPPKFGLPGIVYFAGTHLNPNVTWWPEAGAFLRYIARCQHMLRLGRFVADVCCYRGDRPYLHWGRWTDWRAEGAGAPGAGCAYDILSTEALLERASVKDGAVILPDGMRYRVLALDLEEDVVPPAALRKILDLTRQGATVILGTQRPATAPGLEGHPGADADVRTLARELWGERPEGAPARRSLGAGTLVSGMPVSDALRILEIVPDFDGPHSFIHRTALDLDLYFVAGNGTADCTFRVAGRQPELWDAVTGRVRTDVPHRPTNDGRTVVPLCLPENGSVFVVFRRAPDPLAPVAIEGPEAGLELARRDGALEARLWLEGAYSIENARGRRCSIQAAPLPPPLTLDGPWEIRFTQERGAPASATFARLIPWNEHPDAGIRHFSGTATYRVTFELDAARARVPARLQFGELRHVARARLNGRSLGVAWTAPWTLDVTGALVAGANVIEIDVTNLWVNRLIGDAALPPERRITRTNVPLHPSVNKPLRPHAGFVATDPLERSGLIGPVRVEFGRDCPVQFSDAP